MAVYIVAITLSLVLAYLAEFKPMTLSKRNEVNYFYLIASSLPLILLLSFREGVGTDYNDVYVASFGSIANGGDSRYEFGFTLLIRLIQFFTKDYHYIFALLAILTVGLVYLAIYRNRVNVVLAVFIFTFGGFFFFSTNGIRQALAIAILLNAILCLKDIGSIKNKQSIKYICLVLLASTIHISALVFIPLLLLVNFNLYDLKVWIIFSALLLLGPLLGDTMLNLASHISQQINAYINNEQLRNTYLSSGDMDIADFSLCAVPLIIYGLGYKVLRQSRFINTCMLFLLTGILICGWSYNYFILSRFAMMFSPIAIIGVPLQFAEIYKQKDTNKIFYTKVLVAYCLFILSIFIYLYCIKNFSHILPYNTFLSF